MLKVSRAIFLVVLLLNCSNAFTQESNEVTPQVSKFEEAKAFFYSDQLDAAIEASDVAEQMALVENDIATLVAARNIKIKALEAKLALEDALRLAFDTKSMYCNDAMIADACKPCTQIYFRLSEYQKNIKNYSESLHYLDWLHSHCPEKSIAGMYYYKTAMIFLEQEKIDAALAKMDEGIEVVKMRDNTSQLIGVYNQKGLIAKNSLQYREAVAAFEQAIHIIDSTGVRPKLKPIIMGNIGSCYMSNREWEKAYAYLEADAEGSLANEEYGSYVNAVLALVQIDYDEGRFAKAEELLIDLNSNYSAHFENHNWTYYFYLCGKVSAGQEDYKTAYEYALAEKNYEDSLDELDRYQNAILNTEYNGRIYAQITDQGGAKNASEQGPVGITKHFGQPRIPVYLYWIIIGILAIAVISLLVFKRRKT